MIKPKGKHATIVVDIRHPRCDSCKVAIRDDLATHCGMCGAYFDSIVSNHVTLADKLHEKREKAGVPNCAAR